MLHKLDAKTGLKSLEFHGTTLIVIDIGTGELVVLCRAGNDHGSRMSPARLSNGRPVWSFKPRWSWVQFC